jgi:hypothetical protein
MKAFGPPTAPAPQATPQKQHDLDPAVVAVVSLDLAPAKVARASAPL